MQIALFILCIKRFHIGKGLALSVKGQPIYRSGSSTNGDSLKNTTKWLLSGLSEKSFFCVIFALISASHK